jgi:diguanylate cyclase (GGDEF)-like protein
VTDVNQKTLELFKAGSKPQLLSNLGKVFRDGMGEHFKQELLDLWNGRLSYQREGINYSLDGEPINVLVDLRVMPGHEEDFGWVQVAIQDITSRKKAENYLRYLGTHDALTGLYNRAYFEEQMGKAAGADSHPTVGIILADMNGLKTVNDQLGHQAGDALIRRAAEALNASFSDGEVVARIGGDEFAVLLHDRKEADVKKVLERIQSLILLNNRYYHGPELSISVGYSMRQSGEPLEKTFSRADRSMYREKDRHYQAFRK